MLKKVFTSLLLLTALCAPAGANAAGWRLRYVPSTVKLTAPRQGAVSLPPQLEAYRPHLRAARGEWESFQIVVTAGGTPLKKVRIETGSLQSPGGAAITQSNWMIFHENFVRISHPAARYSPDNLWWPDALIPQRLQPPMEIGAGKSAVFWLTLRVPATAAAGNYHGFLRVWANGQARTVPLPVKVEPFTMPAPTLRANVAVYYDALRDWYTKNIHALTDAQFAVLKKQYYDFLLQYHVNAYDLPVPWNSPQAAAYLRNPAVLSVRLPPLSQPEELKNAVSVLQKNHALNKAYYYWIDEPGPERYPEIKDTEIALHQIDPALRQCVTISPNETLNGSVDIWCPNIGDFMELGHLDTPALAAQRAGGRQTWWYTMVEPKYPYPTWLVDDDALAVRRYGGLMAKYGISGFVYSMAHGWGPQPLKDISSFEGTSGDGTLLYPSETLSGKGPMPSIRLMLLRDAMEDYELQKKYVYTNKKIPAALKNALGNYYQMYMSPSSQEDAARFEKLRDVLYDFLDGTKTTFPKNVKSPAPARPFPLFSIPLPQHNDTPSANNRLHSAFEFQQKALPLSYPAKVENLCADEKNVYVTLKAQFDPSLTADWMAVELSNAVAAPRFAKPVHQWLDHSTTGITRWRFIVTRKGNALVEVQTGEGIFRDTAIAWQHQLSVNDGVQNMYTTIFTIPRTVFPALRNAGNVFRMNLLRHYQQQGRAPVTQRWGDDAGDVFLMPRVKVAAQ